LEASIVRKAFLGVVVAVCLMNSAGPVSVRGQASRWYLVEDIGTFGGSYTEGLAINDNGDIAGYAQMPSGDFQAFRYTDAGGLEDLGGSALALYSQAFGINNAGDVVGLFVDFIAEHGFIAPAGSAMQDLLFSSTPPMRLVTSITDDGRLAGAVYTPEGGNHAFRTLLSGELQDLGSVGFNSRAWRMNAAGQVTGDHAPVTYPTSGRFTAFRYSDTEGLVDLGTFGGNTSFGLAINGSNVIVGCAGLDDVRSHAFRAREGAPLEDLGTLGGASSCAEGINDHGEIVGWADLATAQGHAMVYTDSEGMIDLNDAVPADLGLQLVFARAINSRGQIVATSSTLAGIRSYRLTPTERPLVITGVSPIPATLWPPDGRMVPLTVNVTTDRVAACRVTHVSVLESGAPLTSVESDVVQTGDLALSLRARRSGAAVRTYQGIVQCSDAAGSSRTATFEVTVPHDQGGN
jgi:probable HAF family extracellular repeat protein